MGTTAAPTQRRAAASASYLLSNEATLSTSQSFEELAALLVSSAAQLQSALTDSYALVSTETIDITSMSVDAESVSAGSPPSSTSGAFIVAAMGGLFMSFLL